MPKKTRIRKSVDLQVLVSRNSGPPGKFRVEEFYVEDVLWPNEEPSMSSTEHQVIKVPVSEQLSPEDCETFFAVLQAHDLHGSEEMRTAMKEILGLFLRALFHQKLVQKV